MVIVDFAETSANSSSFNVALFSKYFFSSSVTSVTYSTRYASFVSPRGTINSPLSPNSGVISTSSPSPSMFPYKSTFNFVTFKLPSLYTVPSGNSSITLAFSKDELPEGTVYKEGSLKVTKLKVDLYGNILGDGEEVEITPEFGDNGELIVPLGDTNDAYRVEYVTEVTDDEKKYFENNATLKDDE